MITPERTMPSAAADAEDRREQADPAGDLLARELVADDAVGEREDAAAGALDEAGGDQQRQRAGDGGEQGADGEDHSVQSSSRSLPYMSPSRPRIEVPTEAASR